MAPVNGVISSTKPKSGPTSPVEPQPISDATLLAAFLEGRDDSAFETLVVRHTPAIRAACRVWLTSPHDLDDATQATLLILVKRAGSIRKRDSIGAWLYGVAENVARRLKQQRRSQPLEGDVPQSSRETDDAHEVLHQEIARLPEKYRRVVQLCYLAGITTEETAQRLAIPKGTVLTRLAAARLRLHKRLVYRGIAPGILLAVGVNPGTAISPWWLWGIVRAAKGIQAGESPVLMGVSEHIVALSEGVVNAMILNKLKYVAAFALLAAAIVGFGVGQWATASGEPNPRKSEEPVSPGSSKPVANAKESPIPKASAILKALHSDRTEKTEQVEIAKEEPVKPEAKPGRRREAVIKLPTGSFTKDIDVPIPVYGGSARISWNYDDDRVVGTIEVSVMGCEVELSIEGEYSMSSSGVIYGLITSAKFTHVKLAPALEADGLGEYLAFWPLVEPLLSEMLTDMPFSYQCRMHGDKMTISNFRMLLSGPNPVGKLGGLMAGEAGIIILALQAPSILMEGTYQVNDGNPKEQPKKRAPFLKVKPKAAMPQVPRGSSAGHGPHQNNRFWTRLLKPNKPLCHTWSKTPIPKHQSGRQSNRSRQEFRGLR